MRDPPRGWSGKQPSGQAGVLNRDASEPGLAAAPYRVPKPAQLVAHTARRLCALHVVQMTLRAEFRLPLGLTLRVSHQGFIGQAPRIKI
jgi:hypothetical protein